MAINIVDVLGLAHEERTRKVIMDTHKMHAWMHYYPNPGDRDDLHCHPGDQTFMVLEGECTMGFEDGGKAVMKPGMVALIEGGTFYQLENTGTGPMIMMGTRIGQRALNKHITYETKQDVKGIRPKRPTGAKIDYAAESTAASLRK
jgi:mannose-6-phosphate isomerase-like protein (cupin superfamily)